jgi:hypothetical protein
VPILASSCMPFPSQHPETGTRESKVASLDHFMHHFESSGGESGLGMCTNPSVLFLPCSGAIPSSGETLPALAGGVR